MQRVLLTGRKIIWLGIESLRTYRKIGMHVVKMTGVVFVDFWNVTSRESPGIKLTLKLTLWSSRRKSKSFSWIGLHLAVTYRLFTARCNIKEFDVRNIIRIIRKRVYFQWHVWWNAAHASLDALFVITYMSCSCLAWVQVEHRSF